MEPEIDAVPLTESELERLIATTPMSTKLGVVEHSGVLYMTFFKTEKSRKPILRVRLDQVVEAISVCMDAGMLD